LKNDSANTTTTTTSTTPNPEFFDKLEENIIEKFLTIE
jgi:hypothetical protein